MTTKQECETIYRDECLSRRIHPQLEEGVKWFKQLAMFDVRDVRAALDAWNKSSERNARGEPRNNWLPNVGSELVPLVMDIQRKRSSRNSDRSMFVRWECPDCHCGSSGFVAPDDFQTRRCRKPLGQGRICAGAMGETVRRPAHELFSEDRSGA